jgi:hypothetical protein
MVSAIAAGGALTAVATSTLATWFTLGSRTAGLRRDQ